VVTFHRSPRCRKRILSGAQVIQSTEEGKLLIPLQILVVTFRKNLNGVTPMRLVISHYPLKKYFSAQLSLTLG